jgi:H+-transporting ATPase
VIFLQIVGGGHLLPCVMRFRETMFSPPWPALRLVRCHPGGPDLAVMICGFGWFVPAIPWTIIELVWAYMLAWTLVLDGVELTCPQDMSPKESAPPRNAP